VPAAARHLARDGKQLRRDDGLVVLVRSRPQFEVDQVDV
jgi:hypothetical protein